LFPIEWPEPFGLVMIEAMREGTPTIAWRRGSVPEVIDEGVTGFVVESIDEAVVALKVASGLNRKAVRQRFEERFTASRMAVNYVTTFEGLLGAAARTQSRDPEVATRRATAVAPVFAAPMALDGPLAALKGVRI